jgi:heterodisulfide reductase subunit C
MDLGSVADLVRSYPWKCVECKTCEICQEKGDDVCPRSFANMLLTDISLKGPYPLL